MSDKDYSNFSMLDLFRTEVESQVASMSEGLLCLENNSQDAEFLESLMRASHSIKGAARMVDIEAIVKISHVMEDCFVAAQNGKIRFSSDHIDLLLKGVDLISHITLDADNSIDEQIDKNNIKIKELVLQIGDILNEGTQESAEDHDVPRDTVLEIDNSTEASKGEYEDAGNIAEEPDAPEAVEVDKTDNVSPVLPEKQTPKVTHNHANTRSRVVRVSVERMDRLLGLAGEAIVESRWLRPYLDTMMRHKRFQYRLIKNLDSLRESLEGGHLDKQTESVITNLQSLASGYREQFADQMAELEHFDYRSTNLAGRLHREVIASRMRPFSDGTEGLQRMVRDVARSLGKDISLEITGQNTQVDQDVLEKIKAPLNHLLRNAVDHGIETPEERKQAGKPSKGKIHLHACHRAGMLLVTVIDDGRGVDLDHLRAKIIKKGLASGDMVQRMSEIELLDFLFLPSFSTRDQVTELSGRGVGLDVVHDTVKEMRGLVTATSKKGNGVRFSMQLPLTLSVIRTLLVEIGGECYAFPLARIDHLLKVPIEKIEILKNQQYLNWNGNNIGLISAAQIFGLDKNERKDTVIPVVVISDRQSQYGVIVDSFLGERELAVQVLDSKFGKVKDISVAALLDDGSPTLIIDVDDLVRSIDIVVSGGRVDKHVQQAKVDGPVNSKRILVIDDSITVREVQRNLLETCGYDVDVAVDGVDGWNAVREGGYSLVITDIDMPRMDGIELVQLIKQEPVYKDLPVMIVSYKDREEDRKRGLDAGADYYLTKGSFHDESLREAVEDLIGEV
ncbi:MAG: response regulator [Gammaproteobacteria bacterium]